MGFNKANYRKLRKQGKRGQGPKPERKFEPSEGEHMVRGPKRMVMVNRKRARQRLRSRWYADEEDKVGRTFTTKGAKHQHGPTRHQRPLFPPDVSNHERVFRQRIKSGRIKLNEGDQNGK